VGFLAGYGRGGPATSFSLATDSAGHCAGSTGVGRKVRGALAYELGGADHCVYPGCMQVRERVRKRGFRDESYRWSRSGSSLLWAVRGQ
jgi:hypothetical protein